MFCGSCKFCNYHISSNSPSSNTFLICLEMVDLLRWKSSAIWSSDSQTVSSCNFTSIFDSPSGV